MMESIASALAPKLEVGQYALYDALRARDSKRATRIVKRVAASEAGARGDRRITQHRVQEADLNAPDSEGLRPIHLAAMRGMSETVAALLEAGVPPDAMGVDGNTALHLAAWHKEDGAVAVLMRAGASPNQENTKGRTAIDLAKTEMTLTLLCPLHYCAARGLLDNLVAEVAKGRSVNSAGRGGETPLHAAASAGNADSARLLLARDADPLRENAAGETPLDVARRSRGVGRGDDANSSSSSGLFGGNLVGILEGAVEGAAAARAAKEAEKAAKRGKEEYKEGEAVVYMRGGERHPAAVMKVHRDDEEPYYTVRVHATGRERQTDANHLVRNLPQNAPASTAHSDGAGTGEEPVGAGAGMENSAVNGSSNSRSASLALGHEMEPAGSPGRGGAADGGDDGGGADVEAWAAASAELLDLAGDLSGAAAGTGEAASLAPMLVSAFAAMPAGEVGAILVRKLREEAQESDRRREEPPAPEIGGVDGCFGSGMHDDRGEVVVGGGDGEGGDGRAGSLADASSDAAGVVCRRGQREEGEGVAHAVADACRELVLTCLVGRDERRGGR